VGSSINGAGGGGASSVLVITGAGVLPLAVEDRAYSSDATASAGGAGGIPTGGNGQGTLGGEVQQLRAEAQLAETA